MNRPVPFIPVTMLRAMANPIVSGMAEATSKIDWLRILELSG